MKRTSHPKGPQDAVRTEATRASFGKKLLVYVLVWLLLITGTVLLLRSGLAKYEAAQPERVLETYIAAESHSAFYRALLQIYPDAENAYEPLLSVADELAERYSGGITYTRLVRESTYENPVYLLQSEGENLLKITLQQTEEPLFLGLPGYRVQNSELVLSEALTFTDYGIVFPSGAEVFVNGKKLNADTAQSEKVFAVFGDDGFTACLPSSFFSRPTVTAFLNGEPLTPKEGEHFIFDPENKLRTLHIEVPEGATVQIDGKAVSGFFVSGAGVSEPDALGNTVPTVQYTVPTVGGTGAVTASVNGATLQTETVNEYTSAWPIAYTATVRIPPTAVLYADGAPMPTSLVTDKHAPLLSELAVLRDPPAAHTYVFDRLYALPVFTAADGGVPLTAAEDGDATVFLPAASSALAEDYTDAALRFADAYLRYTTQGYRNTRENLDALQALVDPKSPLYASLERSYIGYQFASPQQISAESISVENFLPLSETLFTCEISYKLDLSNWVGEIADANTLRVTFSKQASGVFLPVAMTQIGK